MKIQHALFTCLIAFVLGSCANSIRGWSSHPVPGSNTIHFDYLNGKTTDTIDLAAGEQLRLRCKASNNTGTLGLSVALGSRVVWHREIDGATDSTFTLPIAKSGKYKIVYDGRNASGKFEVDYSKMQAKHIQVIINKNIELFGLMLQLDNGPDALYNKDSVTIYGKRVPVSVWCARTCANYLRYKAFDSCAMMQTYRGYLNKGFYNDFFISLMLEVDQVPYAKINEGTENDVLLPFSSKGDLEEGKRNATAFLDMMNAFYKQVNFGQYLKENASYQAQAKANVEKCLPPDNFLPTMEGFYQKSFNGYRLVPSLNLLSGTGFGKMNKKTGIIYNSFGPFTLQTFDKVNPQVGYDKPEYIRNLSVHEFGHSFVNPAIDKVPDTLIKSSAYLFAPIKETMTRLSYPGWRICLYESFVRAGEVVIARKLGDTATADKTLNDNVQSGFIYLPEIVAQLEIYGHDQAKYPSYDDFVPLVLEKLKALHSKP